MRYPDGPLLYTYRLWKNPKAEHVVGLLKLLGARAQGTGKRIILVLDNGSIFTSNAARAELDRLKEGIMVFWLPTYTSEQLNYIENLWLHLKKTYFRRMLTRDPDRFPQAVLRLLNQLAAPGAVRRALRPLQGGRGGKDLCRVA